jgi:hypothetical protein
MTLVAQFAFSSICIARIFLHLGSVFEGANATLTSTSPLSSKLVRHTHRQAPPKAHDSDKFPHGATTDYVTSYSEAHGRVSWIPMDRLETPRQHDSSLEGA